MSHLLNPVLEGAAAAKRGVDRISADHRGLDGGDASGAVVDGGASNKLIRTGVCILQQVQSVLQVQRYSPLMRGEGQYLRNQNDASANGPLPAHFSAKTKKGKKKIKSCAGGAETEPNVHNIATC